jgi:hypothetical protein
MMRKVFLVIFLILVALVAREALSRRGVGSGSGERNFTATATDGQRIELASYKGRSAVLLNFFSIT